MHQRCASILFLAAFVSASPSWADIVHLADGGALEGTVRRDGDEVVVRVDGGELRLPASDVLRVEVSEAPIEALNRRRASFPAGAPGPRVEAARWAAARGLHAEARGLWREVLSLAPDHAEARAALGFERREGRWIGEDEANAARGLVRVGGRWVSAESLAREEAAAERERDRARQAELAAATRAAAEAARAAADAAAEARAAQSQESSMGWGMPWFWGFGLPVGPTVSGRRLATPPGAGYGLRTRAGNPGGQVVAPRGYGARSGSGRAVRP